MVRVAALALLLPAVAAAADDGVKAWKDEIRRIERLEQKFWREFQRRYTDALITFSKPQEDAYSRPNDAVNYVYDYSGIRNLYADHALAAEEKGKADLALAASGDPKALPQLLEALLDVAKRIDELEAELLEARAQQGGHWFDQRPSVERHGLAIRLDGLVRALAQGPNAATFLAGEGLKATVKRDGKRSIVRRVALLDTLGLCPGDEARAALVPFAAAPESSLRIAAAEALLRQGPTARPALEPLLADPSPPVRRALLQGIATTGAGDPGWIAPVLSAYGGAQGLLRDDAVRALEALTNQRFGDAPAAWNDWLSDYKGEIDGGKFRKDAIEVREAKREVAPAGCTFYGISMPSRGVILAFEGSRRCFWPADLDVLLKGFKENWHRQRRSWEDEHPSHLATLLKEFDKTAASLAPDISFAALSLYGACDAQPLGSPKMLKADKRDIRAVRHDLERLPGDGWCAQYEGLLAAARLAGLGPETDADFPEPRADTICLWDSGGPQGGRYMTPEAALAAFRRFNRFRRLVVHTIRICDEGEPAETLMKGLAESTGGTYVWAKKPPT
jgi:hypothetical protein